MKFLIVIVFATMGDLYVFTEPTFKTKNECMEFLLQEFMFYQSNLDGYHVITC